MLESFEKTFSMTFIRMSIWCLFLMTSVLAPFATTHAASSGYWLEVETSVVHEGGVLDGQTTYRVYLNTLNETDYLSACSGDDANPLVITAPEGWYNSPFNAGWNATGINPLFLGMFPELVFDSFLDIGGFDSNSSVGPSLATGAVAFEQQFVGPTPTGSSFVVDDATGGAWFIPFPGLDQAATHPGFAGPEKRVLVAQLTSAGEIDGQIRVQVFIEGDQSNEFRGLLPFCPTGTCGGCTDELANNYDAEAFYDDGSCDFSPFGCTDATACNYSPSATEDNGTCVYPSEELDCDGNCLVAVDCLGVCGGSAVTDALGACNGPCAADADADGICDDEDLCIGSQEDCVVPGCTDEFACNYEVQATTDDGSCESVSCQWCDDPSACNFEGLGFPWTANSNLCVYVLEGECDCAGNVLDVVGVCGGACSADADEDGVCDDVDPCVGTLDACGACNGPGAIYGCGCEELPEGDCGCDGEQLDALGVCGGNCAEDADGDGWCDACIDPSADPDFCEDLDPCFGIVDECGVCDGPGANFECGCSVLLEGECDCDGNQLDAVGICGGDCLEDADGDGICDLLQEGCTDVEACNYFNALNDDGSCIYPAPFYDCFDECLLDADGDGVCDELEVEGCTDDTACNFNSEATEEDGTCATLDECGECGGSGTLGCIDSEACNYDAEADCDDGTCAYPEAYYGCDAACLNDADMDGVCDELEIIGCQEDGACNYDPAATDAGECLYAEVYFDCSGNCLMDADADGVCDELEILGCTDDMACNFNAEATEEDGTCATLDECGECGGSGTLGCIDSEACNYDAEADCDDGTCAYPEEFFDCEGACLMDGDADGVCDELEIPGCTDVDACNYSLEATEEDGSCAFAEEYVDCDGNCLNDADEDGVCDELEIPGCTDVDACNYSAEATDENGSCDYPGDPCDDEDDTTINDVLTADCDCAGEVDGLGDVQGLAWGVFPSPVRDMLNLQATDGVLPSDAEVHILSSTGQTLRTERLAGRTQIDVSDLASGIYFLSLRSPAMATTTRRFVVAGGE